MVLAASDPSGPHESHRLEDGQVLAHRLASQREAVLHREASDERKERLPVLIAEFVEERAADGRSQGIEEVDHSQQ